MAIDLVADNFPPIALGYEGAEGHVMLERPRWYSAAVNDYEDDYGQEWTYQQRSELEFTCHTIYFITVVLCRIAVLYSCRTRRDSILGQIF
ncbi:PREDICTED: sodium/potassium-transporting ATPase subunit alpha-3-like, partial [Rhagoletis zephyria]|uniref:sodium/potassium-transporting ATPase subunit alpha-3-like n=1 Tax=Rhagoletis zephyria TaxID=28612 RepID=UPI0008117566